MRKRDELVVMHSLHRGTAKQIADLFFPRDVTQMSFMQGLFHFFRAFSLAAPLTASIIFADRVVGIRLTWPAQARATIDVQAASSMQAWCASQGLLCPPSRSR